MKLKLNGTALQAAVLAASLACAVPAAAQQPAAPPAPDNAPFDVGQLFASTCGFCHSDGGRAAGRGPQLMNSPRRRRLPAQPHQDRQERRHAGVRRLVQRRADRRHHQVHPGIEAACRDENDPSEIREHGMKAILPLMVAGMIGLTGPAQAPASRARSATSVRSGCAPIPIRCRSRARPAILPASRSNWARRWRASSALR